MLHCFATFSQIHQSLSTARRRCNTICFRRAAMVSTSSSTRRVRYASWEMSSQSLRSQSLRSQSSNVVFFEFQITEKWHLHNVFAMFFFFEALRKKIFFPTPFCLCLVSDPTLTRDPLAVSRGQFPKGAVGAERQRHGGGCRRRQGRQGTKGRSEGRRRQGREKGRRTVRHVGRMRGEQ